MATFENTVTIRRSVEDVFTFLADFENVPTWNHPFMVVGNIVPFRSRISNENLIALTQAGRSHSSSQPWPVISRFLGALSPPELDSSAVRLSLDSSPVEFGNRRASPWPRDLRDTP